VAFALEGDVRPRPQRLHDLDLFFRRVAAVPKILAQSDELHRVPPDPAPGRTRPHDKTSEYDED
jgi:hypothetical protein